MEKITIVLKKTRNENQGTKVTYVAVVSKPNTAGTSDVSGRSPEELVKNLSEFLIKEKLSKKIAQLQTTAVMTATVEETHLVFNESEFLSFKQLFFKKN